MSKNRGLHSPTGAQYLHFIIFSDFFVYKATTLFISRHKGKNTSLSRFMAVLYWFESLAFSFVLQFPELYVLPECEIDVGICCLLQPGTC